MKSDSAKTRATLTGPGYEQVQQILNAAAGQSTADYGGIGKFWELPLEQFLEVRLGGVPLIGVEATPATCGGPAGTPPLNPGPGAASGLVKGLRGEPPFDGSKFPRLPWGGTAVADSDIRLVSDWIDDGCPPTGRKSVSLDAAPLTAAFPTLEVLPSDNVEDGAGFICAVPDSSEYRYQQGELKQRRNIDCLTADQLEKYRLAFRRMYELNKWPEDYRNYNNMALIHQNHCQHGWERFLPWHRIYLYEFEQALQDVCPDVTLPYWDWTMPQYWPEHPDKGWRIPMSLQAFLTEESLRFLHHAKPSIPAPQIKQLRKDIVEKGTHFYSQSCFFKAVAASIGPEYIVGEHRLRFIDALLAANSLWYPLRYPGEYKNQQTINQAVHYHYPTANDIEQILSLRTFHDFGGGSIYNDSFGFLDQNPHNTMHLWTGGNNPDHAAETVLEGDAGTSRNRGVKVAGRKFHSRDDMYSQPEFGDMFSNLTASYDPVFWPVHSNVDRLWHEWQSLHPNSLPADLDSVLTPWSYTIADTLDMSRFGYEYVKCSFMIPVGLAAPVGRFVSKGLDLPETVRKNKFQRAEVRLHRVPQLPRSCFIRVFLNLPDANASTPIDGPNYAGYLAVFGHGPCIGGPGHCALPPAQPRKYDQRPRSHNTPRTHRVDVTGAARKLIKDHATSLQVTLVVIGADYQQDNELLRLDGVSLNFLD
jgi:tyrosinase